MQGTVASYDAATRSGVLLLDDGTEMRFPARAFDASGLRLLRLGQRVRIDEWVGEEPYLMAKVSELPDEVDEGPELTALMRNVQQTFTHIIEEVPYLPEELQMAVANLEDPSALAHLIAGALRIKVEEKQALLEEVRQNARFDAVRGIVDLKQVAAAADPPYYVMAFADQGSLADRLAVAKRLPAAPTVLELDVTSEDDLAALPDRLREAGVAVAQKRFDGQIHAFFQMVGVFPAATEAIADAAGELRSAFA